MRVGFDNNFCNFKEEGDIMLLLRSGQYETFFHEIGNRRIICFGAGGAFENFIRTNEDRAELLDRIDIVLDNNKALSGTIKKIAGRAVPVKTLSEIHESDIDSERIVIVLTTQYVVQVVSQLNALQLFDQIPCYLGGSFSEKRHPQSASRSLSSATAQLTRTYAIPKIIHYCWFGEKDMPALERTCVESWKKYCPDYKFVLWNEKNYDIRKCRYMNDAYDAKRWGFVPDYARLDILYQYGGVYLDTDVELLKNIDEFLQFKAFFSFETLNLVAPGLGFGSIAGNRFLKEMLDEYEDFSFINGDGSLNMTPGPRYTTDYFEKIGFRICNEMQIRDDILLLPSDYFCPMNQITGMYELTENTYGVHKFTCSWFDKEQRDEWEKYKAQIAKINERLLKTWQNAFDLVE